MVSDDPDIALTGDRGCGAVHFWNLIGGIRLIRLASGQADFTYEDIDFGGLEAPEGESEIEVEPRQVLQLECEQFFIPPGVLGETVIRDDIRANLRLAQIFEADGGNGLHFEKFCGLDAPVAGDDAAASVDQDRVREAEFLDAVRDLAASM